VVRSWCLVGLVMMATVRINTIEQRSADLYQCDERCYRGCQYSTALPGNECSAETSDKIPHKSCMMSKVVGNVNICI
jgi:hypothetical protein